MKHNQKGFSIIELLLIIILAGALGGIGWYVWGEHSKKIASNDKPVSTSNEKKESSSDEASTVTDVKISLKTEADISKLPDDTPASFKAFMLEKLKANTTDGDGCITVYTISKISAVNILGSAGSASASGNDSDSCMGGAPLVWVLAPTGKWDEVSLNGPTCKSENGGLVYEEFAADCSTGSDSSSSTKNPNGSVTAIKQ